MSLRDYTRKRRFQDTPEPDADAGGARKRAASRRPIFVVQLHHARARHYDFRLEADGALKSWGFCLTTISGGQGNRGSIPAFRGKT